jgi:hypothetical protein
VRLELDHAIPWNFDRQVRVASDGALPPWEMDAKAFAESGNRVILINFFGRMWGQTIHVCLSDWP